MPPLEKIVRKITREGDLQPFRLEKLHGFQCVRCQAKKKSTPVVVQGGGWSRLLCNGCYGRW